MHRVLPRAVICFVLLVMTVGGVAAQTGTPEPGAENGKTLRIYDFEFPMSLDPSTDYSTLDIAGLNYEGLTRTDKDFNVVPGAAESWEFSEDGLTLTFHLRDNLTFSDGSPLTAEHFRAAVARNCDPVAAVWTSTFLYAIEGCESWATSLAMEGDATPGATPLAESAVPADLGISASDGRTLVISLREPAPYLPAVASTWAFYPFPVAAMADDPEGWWRDPDTMLGNGPFQIDQVNAVVPRQNIRLVANEHYWGGRPKLDVIEHHYFVGHALALDAYEQGQLDIGWVPFPFGSQPEIAESPELQAEIVPIPLPLTYHLAFDLTQEPFQEKRVREALAYGLDREGFCREVWSGQCSPAYSWIPPGTPGHTDTTAYAYDPDAARQALAESSYGGPANLPPIIYHYGVGPDTVQNRAEAEWFARNYRESLGIELVLKPTSDVGFEALAEINPVISMTWWSWLQDYPDPQNWMADYWACDSPFYAQEAGYCNPAYDALIAAARVELDPEQRMALYEEAGEVLVDDLPGVFFIYDVNPRLVKPYVTGYLVRAGDPWPGWWNPLTIDIVEAPA